jgi:hypothetical protein
MMTSELGSLKTPMNLKFAQDTSYVESSVFLSANNNSAARKNSNEAPDQTPKASSTLRYPANTSKNRKKAIKAKKVMAKKNTIS